MTTAYKVQWNDGYEYTIEGPDDLSDDDVLRMAEAAIPAQAPAPANTNNWLDDTWASAKSAALGSSSAVAAGVLGADSAIARSLSDKAEAAGRDVSAAREAELQGQAARRKAAEATGDWTEEVKAAGQNFMESPVQAAAGAVGSMLPIAITAFGGKFALGARAVTALMGLVGTAQGAGATKNAIYEAVRDAEVADGKPANEAQAKAIAAQEYFGENWGNILTSGAIGLGTSITGAERLLPGASRVAGAAESALANRVGARAAQALMAGVVEAPTEGLQGGQERYASNVALQRTGRDVPTWQGVAGQSTEEALAGGIGGVALGGARRAQSEREDADDEAKALKDALDARVKASYEAEAKAKADAEAEAAAQAEIDARPRLPAPEEPAAAAAPAPAAPTPDAPVPEPTLREKPAPAVPKEITPESVSESAYKYAQRTQGQKFLAKLQAVNPEKAQELRKELVGNSSNKDELFTAIFGEGQTSAAYVEPAPAPVAESPITEPTITIQPTQEERVQEVENKVKELEAERTKLLTVAGKPPVARSPAGQKYADLTAQLTALSDALPAPAAGTTGFAQAFGSLQGGGTTADFYRQAYAALVEGKTRVAGVKDPVLARAKVAFDAGLIKSPADLSRFEQDGYPVAPAPVAPAPVAPAPAADRPSDAIMDQVRELETQNRALLTSNGKLPVGPKRKTFESNLEKIAELKDQWDTADRAERAETKPVTPTAQAADTAVEGAGDTQPTQEAPVEPAPEPAPVALDTTQLVEEAPATPEVDALDAEVQKAESEFEANWAGKPMPKYGTEERGQYAAGQRNIESLKRKRDEAVEAAKPKGPKQRVADDTDSDEDTGKDIELDGVENVLTHYNSEDALSTDAKTRKAWGDRASRHIQYLKNVRDDRKASKAARDRAKEILKEEIDPKDIKKSDDGRPLLKSADTDKPKVEGLDDAVEAGDTREALAAIRDSGYASAFDKMVAERLMKFRDLPKIAKRGDIAASGQYDAIADEVQLKDVGIHTTLHEVVHGFLHRLIADHEAGMVKSPAIDNLRQLYDYVAKKHPEWRKEYGFKNLSEFASEAMSNATFQTALNTVPYQQTSAFTAFVRRVMQALGIKPTSEHTALMESVVQVDAALEQGREYQTERTGTRVEGKLDTIEEQREEGESKSADTAKLSQTSEDIIKSSKIANPESKLEKLVTKTAKAVSTREGVSLADKFRTIAVDNMAAASTRLNQLFDNEVRSALGFINPEPLMRQAMDSGKLLLAWTRGGVLSRDPTTGLWRVEPAQADTKTFERVLDKIETWGKANGKTFPQAYAAVSKLLEAKRLQGIRASNAAGTTDIDINMLSKAFGGTTDSQIDALVADFDADAALQEIQADLNEMRGKLIDNMVLAGRITAAEAADWKSVLDYVPFSRIADFEKVFKARRGVGRGMTAFKSLPEIIGSEQLEVTNVLDNFVSLSGWMIQQTVRADAAHKALDMLRRMGYAQRHTSKPRIDESKVVSTYENGIEVWYSLPSRFDALAFAQPGDAALNSLMFRAFRTFSNLLRGTITALPPFAIKQVVDDIQRAYVYSGLEQPYKIIWPTLKNFAMMGTAEVFGKEHALTQELERQALVGEFDFNTDKPAESILQDLGYMARGPVQKWVHRLQGFTRASDLAVRAAIYEQTMKETSGDALKAQTRAREFINFRRRGTSQTLNALGTMVPFMNAYVQGMDVLYRNATGKGSTSADSRNAAKRMFWAQGAKLAALTAIYALLTPGADGDDEDKKKKKGSDRTEVDERTRFSNWVLGGGVKVPVPREIAMIFKVPTETALDYMRRLGTAEEQEAAEATITVLRYAMEQVSYGLPIPTAIRPVLEAISNTSFFTGRQLETSGQEKLDPSQRMRDSTSELAKAISNSAEGILVSMGVDPGKGISPIKIDNFLNGYFGTTAAMVTMATDQALNPDRLDRPLAKWAFASTFMYNKDVMTGRKDEFYELRNKVAPKLATLDALMKRDPSKVDAYIEANKQAIIMAQATQTATQELANIRTAKTWLQSPAAAKHPDWTKEARETKVKELTAAERGIVSWLREYKARLAKQ